MTDDVEGVPGVFSLVAQCPSFGQIAQKSIESDWGADEQGERVIEVMGHKDSVEIRYV
jgi:hypothetical protein